MLLAHHNQKEKGIRKSPYKGAKINQVTSAQLYKPWRARRTFLLSRAGPCALCHLAGPAFSDAAKVWAGFILGAGGSKGTPTGTGYATTGGGHDCNTGTGHTCTEEATGNGSCIACTAHKCIGGGRPGCIRDAIHVCTAGTVVGCIPRAASHHGCIAGAEHAPIDGTGSIGELTSGV